MSHLLDDDDDDLQGHQNHRELTLSTGTVLGIFLGLALSWALFFGFGYHMGSKVRPEVQPTAEAPDPASSTNFNSFKPAPGSPASGGSSSSTPAPANSDAGPVQTILPASASHPDTTTPPDPTATAEKPAPISLHATQAATTPPAPLPATGTFVVQVAAVSHQEDADLLVNALHGKGYSVSAHPGPDNLVHIQVGPFNSRKEADSMRQQLLSDGYNAIVK